MHMFYVMLPLTCARNAEASEVLVLTEKLGKLSG